MDLKLTKGIYEDLCNVLREARNMRAKEVRAFRDIPLKNVEVVISALEKQIPKIPNVEGDGYADGELVYDTWICPYCEEHYEINYDDYDYCPRCGQHIEKVWKDWDE